MSNETANKLEKRFVYGLITILLSVCAYFLNDFKVSQKENVTNIRADVKAVNDKVEDIKAGLVTCQQQLNDHIREDEAIHSK